MSVYSGFATRQQETKYNSLVETLVIALKKRVIKFYNEQRCDQDKFKLLIKKIYKKMFLLQKGKFLAPKYTSCFGDLIEMLKIQINYDSMSDVSSMVSQSFTIGVIDDKKQQKKSTTHDTNFIRSRSILQNKKNQIQHAFSQSRSLEHSIANSYQKIKLRGIENQERRPSYNNNTYNTEDSIEQEKDRMKIAARLKLKQLKQLRQLRGTLHMPKIEDYVPKQSQMQPKMFETPKKLESIRQQRSNKDHRSFRRQKFSRMQIQEL